MTDLIGPTPKVDGYRLTPNRINIVYPTQREAEATLQTLQAHSHPDYEHSEVVEYTAPAPKHPTPWTNIGSSVRDANDSPVMYADSVKLAEGVVEAVNAYYGGPQPVNFRSKREPRVFWEEPPADVKKLRSSDGIILERHPGGGWHWTTDRLGRHIGIDNEGVGWKWNTVFIGSDNLPLVEVID